MNEPKLGDLIRLGPFGRVEVACAVCGKYLSEFDRVKVIICGRCESSYILEVKIKKLGVIDG